MTQLTLLLAQATSTPAAGPTPQSEISFWSPQVIGLPLAILVLFGFMMWSQTRERRRFAEMVASLKRNDRVETIGGLYGTVVEVRDNEIILKVDETNNVKMRFNRSAIKSVFRDATAEKKPPDSPAGQSKK